MDHRRLGTTGLHVSPLCLGAMTFGEADEKSFMHKVGCDEATAHQIMSRALDAGVNFIDTADVYGQDGLAERVVGSWFAASGRRDDVVLATKFRFRMADGPNGTGASRHRILRAVEASLRRLRTDRIDLYQVHCQDMNTPEEETLRALDDLVRAGKVLYLGASNYTAYRLVESLALSERRGWAGYATIQMQYNLLTRDIEREHVPACARWGLGILPWSPLAGGLLTGKYGPGAAGPSDGRLKAADRWSARLKKADQERTWKILDAVREVARARDTSPAAVALAWLTHKPQVSSVIFGARTIEQLDANLAAATLSLAPSELSSLDLASRPDYGYPYEFIAGICGKW